MNLLPRKTETPIHAAIRILGAVTITFALLLGILAVGRPASTRATTMVLGEYGVPLTSPIFPRSISQDNSAVSFA